MIDRGSLAGTIGAYLTGVAVTSAPWLLTTAVLTSLRLVARFGGTPDFLNIERIVTLVYALTVVFSAPVHVVVSRAIADRLYERRLDQIAAPLWRAVALTVVGFLILGAALMLILGVSLPIGVAGTMLTVVVGTQWLLLSVGGGLSSPTVVLRAFCLGAPLSIVAALIGSHVLGLGALGYLYGYAAGQLVTLAFLLRGVAAVLPPEMDEGARLAPAFAEYWLLALSSLVYYLSIWTDKIVIWVLLGREAAEVYSGLSAIAWFSVIPAFGWIYVNVETAFYRRFRTFYGALEAGAPLARLHEGAAQVATESRRILLGAAEIQLAGTLIVLLAAAPIVRVAGMRPESVWAFRLVTVGAAIQVLALLEILLLYYFDLRREALLISLVLLGGEAVLMTLAQAVGVPPAVGYPFACLCAALTGLALVRSRLRTLLADTFQSQPFSSAT
jgi:uncharacterized membrane protein